MQLSSTFDHPVIGILAHADAGKTTLAEGMLYLTGAIRKAGRVDHRDCFLDTHGIERERGITVFSKQAELILPKGKPVTLLDTPGHADFAAETERTLQVLDAAILVISAADGVTGQVRTFARQLQLYEVPMVVFVNKMDQAGASGDRIWKELEEMLGEGFVMWKPEAGEEFYESVAMCSEELMEEYAESDCIGEESLQKAVHARTVFPVLFGSALRLEGISELLETLEKYVQSRKPKTEFGARVFKIMREDNGERVTFLKITGGELAVKDMLGEEKVDQLRIYQGNKYTLVKKVEAGTICAVTGVHNTKAGQGFGAESGIAEKAKAFQPVLEYCVSVEESVPVATQLDYWRRLEEELPELSVFYQEQTGQIHVNLMGEVQLEVLKRLMKDRFLVTVVFDEGAIVYRETILSPVVGVGHYEPLRHYAEVHIKMEPLPRGSGLEYANTCDGDALSGNFQRLIMSHLQEKTHLGVLTGAPVTDIKFTLLSAKISEKHTEGGDLREATYRAVRQGLMEAESGLLEPVYAYRIVLPQAMLGRAMTDIKRFGGTMKDPEMEAANAVIEGIVPAACVRGYQKELTDYTSGEGQLTLEYAGYEICHNAQEVIEQCGYEAERDTHSPSGSIFCAHGAGYFVPWSEVKNNSHIPVEMPSEEANTTQVELRNKANRSNYRREYQDTFISQEEIEEIFLRTFGNRALDRNPWNRSATEANRSESMSSTDSTTPARESTKGPTKKPTTPMEEYLLVDGYNIIFAWKELSELARENLDSARGRLMDILCNYQGYWGHTVIVVFDAYKVIGNPGSTEKYHNIHVVYTKEAETADRYIERTVHEIGHRYRVTVATSDALEQLIVFGGGANRISAREFEIAVRQMNEEHRELLH